MFGKNDGPIMKDNFCVCLSFFVVYWVWGSRRLSSDKVNQQMNVWFNQHKQANKGFKAAEEQRSV